MRSSLVYLLLVATLVYCSFGDKIAKIKSAKDATLPVPGLDQAFCHGVDRKDGRTRGPIFDYTYNNGKTWINPVDNVEYLVPDNVEVIATPSQYMDMQSYLLENMSDVTNMHREWSKWHFGIPGYFIDFDYTSMSMHMKEELLKKSHKVYLSELDLLYYRMQTWPMNTQTNQANSHFNRMMSNLPSSCDTDDTRAKYKTFRETFGTDYAPEADFGGMVTMSQSVDTVLYEKHTEDWVYHQVSLSFQWAYYKIGVDFGRNSSEFKFDHEFMDHMHFVFEWGGYNVTTNISDWKQYQDKIIIEPVAVHPRLSPLTDLFTDPAKKACMKREIDAYMSDNKPPEAAKKLWSDMKKRGDVYDRDGPEVMITENGVAMKLHLPRTVPKLEISDGVKNKKVSPDPSTYKGILGHKKYSPYGSALSLSTPPVFGYDSIGYGWDAVRSMRRSLPLVEYTWTKGRTWSNPMDRSQTYTVPDQLQVIDVPSSWTCNVTETTNSYESYQHEEQHSTSHHGFLGFGSKKTTTYTYVQKAYQEDYSHSDYNERYAWYRLSIPPLPPPRLSASFSLALSKLPLTYNKNDADSLSKYMEFLSTFGTHYMKNAYIGGAANLQTWFHSCFIDSFTATYVTKQSSWSFIIISHDSGSQDAHSKIDANWWAYSDSQIKLVGGSQTVYDASELPKWRATVVKNMTPIEFQIEPISDLVSDANLKAQLLAAIADFMGTQQTSLDQYAAQLDTHEPHEKPSWCVWKN